MPFAEIRALAVGKTDGNLRIRAARQREIIEGVCHASFNMTHNMPVYHQVFLNSNPDFRY